jgi:hypothetical protein
VDGQRFLVTVCEPLQLTIQVAVEQESQGVLRPALQGQLELLRSKGLRFPAHKGVRGPAECPEKPSD